MILLSLKTKSNWHIFHPEGPKPELYNKLPVVYTGTRHGVKTERIVREKSVSSPSSKADFSDFGARKSKGRAQGTQGSDFNQEEVETPAPPIKVRCVGMGTSFDGILTKQEDKVLIIHKSSRYSIKKFALLAGCLSESETESDAMKRIQLIETSESLETYLETHSLISESKASTKRSTSSSGDAGGMHFFDEETPG